MDGVAEAAKVAKEAVPLVSQQPMATALVVVVIFALIVIGVAVYVIRSQTKTGDKMAEAMSKLSTALDVLSKASEGMARSLDSLPTIREHLAVLRDRAERED
jgi:hypothetical protein